MWSPTLLLSDSLQCLQSTDFASCLAMTLSFKLIIVERKGFEPLMLILAYAYHYALSLFGFCTDADEPFVSLHR